jgi:hypothetical protein
MPFFLSFYLAPRLQRRRRQGRRAASPPTAPGRCPLCVLRPSTTWLASHTWVCLCYFCVDRLRIAFSMHAVCARRHLRGPASDQLRAGPYGPHTHGPHTHGPHTHGPHTHGPHTRPTHTRPTHAQLPTTPPLQPALPHPVAVLPCAPAVVTCLWLRRCRADACRRPPAPSAARSRASTSATPRRTARCAYSPERSNHTCGSTSALEVSSCFVRCHRGAASRGLHSVPASLLARTGDQTGQCPVPRTPTAVVPSSHSGRLFLLHSSNRVRPASRAVFRMM